MNKSDLSADKQLLCKLQDRLLTASMRCKAQKTHRMSQETVEKDDTSLPFLYRADYRAMVARWMEARDGIEPPSMGLQTLPFCFGFRAISHNI